MKDENCLGLNIIVREQRMGKKQVFIVNNDELGVSDFGDTLDEAVANFKKSMNLYLETYPEKKVQLIKENTKPLLLSRIFL